MTLNKIIITTSGFILTILVMNAQDPIEAGIYEDIISATPISLAGRGSLLDWANLKKFKYSNDELNKSNDPNRVVFMGNSITEGWSVFNKNFYLQSFC